MDPFCISVFSSAPVSSWQILTTHYCEDLLHRARPPLPAVVSCIPLCSCPRDQGGAPSLYCARLHLSETCSQFCLLRVHHHFEVSLCSEMQTPPFNLSLFLSSSVPRASSVPSAPFVARHHTGLWEHSSHRCPGNPH